MAIFQGDLAEYPVPDLLQFLHGTRKQGQLLLETAGAPAPAGVYFERGELVHAYCPPRTGAPAVYEVLGWSEGRFAFLKGAGPGERTIHEGLQSVLLEGLRQLDELRHARRLLPAPGVVLHLDGETERSDGVRLSGAEWRVLALVNGQRSVAEVIRASGTPETEAARLVHGLIAAGLVTAPGEGG